MRFLLAERDQGTGLQEVLSLQGAGGAERPAGAALALVLDGGHGALLPPVHLIGQLLSAALEDVSGVRVWSHPVAVEGGCKLLCGEICKHVHAQFKAMFLLVVLVNKGMVLLPDGVPLLLSSIIFIVLAVLLNNEKKKVGRSKKEAYLK